LSAPPSHTRARTALLNGRRDWYRITAQSEGPAEVYLHDEIGLWGTTAKHFVHALADLRASAIDLHINSPGGDVFDGVTIYNALRNHPAQVTTYVDGLAASAASFIAMAGQRIVAEPNAMLMIHDAHGLSLGNAADMRSMADLLDKVSDNIASIYAQRTGGIIADWRAAMTTETWYSASEAVDAGLADEVRGQASDEPDMAASFDLSRFTYAGRSAAPAPSGVPRLAASAASPPSAPGVGAPRFSFDSVAVTAALREVFA
jgi:ATP-dependent Clp endopeptidase proteolytic subunit ClpP